MVQHEMKRRKEKSGHHSGASCFSSKIVCGECGHFTTALDAEAEKLKNEIAVVTELTRQSVEENVHVSLDQVEYQQRYTGLVVRYEKAKSKLKKIEELRQARRLKREQLDTFLTTLLRQDSVLTEFDEELWIAVIDKVTVFADDDVRFTFRDGTVIKV